MPAEEFAVAIRGTPTELNCRTAHELLWNIPSTRFKSVMTFREIIHKTYGANTDSLQMIKQSPIILLDPITPIYGHKFTYQLTELSKNPNRK